MKKMFFLMALTVVLAGCSGKLQTSGGIQGSTETPTVTEPNAQTTTELNAQSDTTVESPTLKETDDTTSLSADLDATGIVEENFQ